MMMVHTQTFMRMDKQFIPTDLIGVVANPPPLLALEAYILGDDQTGGDAISWIHLPSF
jgi:hypothetical protein